MKCYLSHHKGKQTIIFRSLNAAEHDLFCMGLSLTLFEHSGAHLS